MTKKSYRADSLMRWNCGAACSVWDPRGNEVCHTWSQRKAVLIARLLNADAKEKGNGDTR